MHYILVRLLVWLHEGVAAATNELAISPTVTFFCGALDLSSFLTYITLVVLPSPVENKKKQANNELSPSFSF